MVFWEADDRKCINYKPLEFKQKLSKNNNHNIHLKNTQKLMNEFCKYFYGLSAPLMKEVIA